MRSLRLLCSGDHEKEFFMFTNRTCLIGVLAAGVSLGATGAASAQLVTQDLSQGLTPEELVATLVGPGVVVTNIQFSGADTAAGKVSGAVGIIGFGNGVIAPDAGRAFAFFVYSFVYTGAVLAKNQKASRCRKSFRFKQ